MDDRNEELERIQKELLAEEVTQDLPVEEILKETQPAEEELSVDDILADEELNALLGDPAEPAFDDPDEIRDPEGEMQYNNFANDYGREEKEAAEAQAKKNDRILVGLMITACVLSLGIIGLLIYWLTMLP